MAAFCWCCISKPMNDPKTNKQTAREREGKKEKNNRERHKRSNLARYWQLSSFHSQYVCLCELYVGKCMGKESLNLAVRVPEFKTFKNELERSFVHMLPRCVNVCRPCDVLCQPYARLGLYETNSDYQGTRGGKAKKGLSQTHFNQILRAPISAILCLFMPLDMALKCFTKYGHGAARK